MPGKIITIVPNSKVGIGLNYPATSPNQFGDYVTTSLQESDLTAAFVQNKQAFSSSLQEYASLAVLLREKKQTFKASVQEYANLIATIREKKQSFAATLREYASLSTVLKQKKQAIHANLQEYANLTAILAEKKQKFTGALSSTATMSLTMAVAQQKQAISAQLQEPASLSASLIQRKQGFSASLTVTAKKAVADTGGGDDRGKRFGPKPRSYTRREKVSTHAEANIRLPADLRATKEEMAQFALPEPEPVVEVPVIQTVPKKVEPIEPKLAGVERLVSRILQAKKEYAQARKEIDIKKLPDVTLKVLSSHEAELKQTLQKIDEAIATADEEEAAEILSLIE